MISTNRSLTASLAATWWEVGGGGEEQLVRSWGWGGWLAGGRGAGRRLVAVAARHRRAPSRLAVLPGARHAHQHHRAAQQPAALSHVAAGGVQGEAGGQQHKGCHRQQQACGGRGGRGKGQAGWRRACSVGRCHHLSTASMCDTVAGTLTRLEAPGITRKLVGGDVALRQGGRLRPQACVELEEGDQSAQPSCRQGTRPDRSVVGRVGRGGGGGLCSDGQHQIRHPAHSMHALRMHGWCTPQNSAAGGGVARRTRLMQGWMR